MYNRSNLLALAGLLLFTAACADQPTGPAAEVAPAGARYAFAGSSASISYQAHVQDHGWMAWVSDGQTAGTTGEGRQMEALRVDLSGSSSPAAEVCYEAHVENYGWMGEVCGNGQTVGTTGQALQMEAVKVRVRNAPDLSVCYRVHIAIYGWQNEVCDGAIAGTTGQALQVEAIQIRLRKPFYAWTDNQTGTPNNILLQGVSASTAPYGQHESFDRQHVWAANCEKYFAVDDAFVSAHKGKGMIYFIGDEPDHDQVPGCYYTPAEYAQVFYNAVTHIRSIDSSARFSNGGFAQPNATPAGQPHFTDYADQFITAYRNLTGGQDPPIVEWRFHGLAIDGATFKTWMTQAADWAGARGQKIFVGSFNGSEMQAMVDHIKADSRITGASWWSYDPGWTYSLTDANGSLTALGTQYVNGTK